MNVSAVVLAAGEGRRVGGDRNKIFLPVGGRPLLTRTIEQLACTERFSEFILVVRHGEEAQVRAILPPLVAPCRIVPGGAVRRDSSLAGVTAAAGDLVLIHDAARPFASKRLIEQIIAGAIRYGACVPALPIPDTLRHASGDVLRVDIVDRSNLYAMQTPQGFNRELIKRCLTAHLGNLPDDAAAALAEDAPVHFIRGDLLNLKITSAGDFAVADRIIQLGFE